MSTIVKPLGRRAYGSIGHLPQSRMGPGDHSVHAGQGDICIKRPRDKHDLIIVQEKLDGSCVSVAKLNGTLHALGRAGWPAVSSKYEQHRLFADWVLANWDRFDRLLGEGERVVGEWLAQAHGTLYSLRHEPFVPFDIMRGDVREPYHIFMERVLNCGFTLPRELYCGPNSFSIDEMLEAIENRSRHGAIDPIEGAVWRVQRKGVVDFLAKYVRPEKVDGVYLPELSGGEAIWNWRP